MVGERNSMKDKVTAIITTHNRIELVKKAINSVLTQTYGTLELVVVDDASDVKGYQELKEFSKKNSFKYIYIPVEQSRGGNYARNLGIKSATGKYVAFLDDDDEWFPTKIEKQMKIFEQNKDIGVVGCGRVDEYDFIKRIENGTEMLVEGDVRNIIWQMIPYTTSTLVMRKDIIYEAGLFDENLRYWQEYDLEIRLSQITKFGVVRENLVLYRIIKKDKGRLTNNLDGWQETVNYIDEKYENILKDIPKEIRKKRKKMIVLDGARRADNMCDRKMKRKYLVKLLKIEPSIKNLIKAIFNKCSLRKLFG